jgi:YHS domain-containing protein
VCSVGNVPLAAALWKGGISFGVISFIFADLIALPLLLIYRRFYGGRLTLTMLAVFWTVMSAARLITEGIFRALGPTTRPTQIVADHFSWNFTAYLNLGFLALFGLLYWNYRNRERLGGGGGLAVDPVCGMQIDQTHAPASLAYAGERVYFCSDGRRSTFEANSSRLAAD